MRILLAEDEEELSKALCTILKHSGYEVEAAFDGAEALERALEYSYDGLILDIMMPKMDGMTVLKTLREKGISTPALFLTAKSELDDRVSGLDAGADDYLTKPFAMAELLARLRAMMRTKERSVPESIECGNVSLKRSTMELCGEESSIRLASKEFAMLEFLNQNFGKVMAKERLLERVWPDDGEADPETVWMYASYLQKKLSSVHADVTITECEDGYRLESL